MLKHKSNSNLKFEKYTKTNPCDDCPAPCCQAQVHTYRAPVTFRDLDMARYRTLFPGTEIVICHTGDWFLLHWINCAFFEQESYSCSVQDTGEKPRICHFFDPYDCWFKQNFVMGTGTLALRLDRYRFDKWLDAVNLDEAGSILSLPTFEQSRRIVENLPVSPFFQRLISGIKKPLRPVLRKEG